MYQFNVKKMNWMEIKKNTHHICSHTHTHDDSWWYFPSHLNSNRFSVHTLHSLRRFRNGAFILIKYVCFFSLSLSSFTLCVLVVNSIEFVHGGHLRYMCTKKKKSISSFHIKRQSQIDWGYGVQEWMGRRPPMIAVWKGTLEMLSKKKNEKWYYVCYSRARTHMAHYVVVVAITIVMVLVYSFFHFVIVGRLRVYIVEISSTSSYSSAMLLLLFAFFFSCVIQFLWHYNSPVFFSFSHFQSTVHVCVYVAFLFFIHFHTIHSSNECANERKRTGLKSENASIISPLPIFLLLVIFFIHYSFHTWEL